ncbi:protein of unknown function [Methylacidimicrobium sp. AP8]|nr:protein of unknown function [Methylacidimicrobium sp. AP8]
MIAYPWFGPVLRGIGRRKQAGVAEWQTRQTQNLVSATGCGFESLRRHPWNWAGSPWGPFPSLTPAERTFRQGRTTP